MPQSGAEAGVAVLIPARRQSSRLADKLLLAETGTPLLIHTCQQASRAFGPASVTVCADDEALLSIARAAGFQAMITGMEHQSGTDRIAEVAGILDQSILVNVQGDEPEIDPEHIRLVVSLLRRHPWASMATLATPCGQAEQHDPSKVKVLLASGERALSFTRAPCPWDRDANGPASDGHRHIGLYAYRRPALLTLAAMPPSRLERCERLEQLRALEAGMGIACAVVDHAPAGIDVRADYDAFLRRYRAAHPPTTLPNDPVSP